MNNENNKRKKTSPLIMILIVLFGLPVFLILLFCLVLISPILLIGYVFKIYFDYRETRLKMKLKLEYKLKTKNVFSL